MRMNRERRDPVDIGEELSQPVAPDDLADASVARADHGPDLPNIPDPRRLAEPPRGGQAHLARMDPRGHLPGHDRRGRGAHRARRGPVGEVGERGVHAHLDAAVRQLGALPSVQLEAEDEGRAEAHRPRQHLPAHRGHVHAARAPRAAARQGLAAARDRLGRGTARHRVPRVLDHGARAGSTCPSTCCSAGRP